MLNLDIHDGYIVASAQSSRKLKLRVTHDDRSLMYDLNGTGTFPLQMGNGLYSVTLFENVQGKEYARIDTQSFAVEQSSNAPYLHHNQYVPYCEAASDMAMRLCADKPDEKKYESIRVWMRQHIRYDYVRAVTIQKGALPDVERCYANGAGICQDIAALAVSMLRSENVPAKLAIGYAGKEYHAWSYVYVSGKSRRYDPTAEILGKKVTSYTIERWY